LGALIERSCTSPSQAVYDASRFAPEPSMARATALLCLTLALAACQTTAERPTIPPGASAEEENQILCRQPRSSPWFVPCSRNLL
jgi:hypothetical protein